MVGEMTPKERFLAVMQGRVPDYVPVEPLMMMACTTVLNEPAGRYYHDAELCAKAVLAAQERYGYDFLLMGVSSPMYGAYMGGSCTYPDDSHPMYETPAIKEPADLDRMEPPDFIAKPPLTFGAVVEGMKRVIDAVGDRMPVGASLPGTFNVAVSLRGMEQFMIDRSVNPDLFRRTIELANTLLIEAGKAYVAAGCDYIWYPDACSSPTCISPADFETYAMPLHAKFFAAMKALDMYTLYHPCGVEYGIFCQLPNIPNIDGYHFSNFVDLGIARKVFGPRQVLWGNLNPAEVLLFGTPEQVEAEVKRIIEAAGKVGAFVLSLGCSLPPVVPPRNIDAMMRARDKYGKYPMV